MIGSLRNQPNVLDAEAANAKEAGESSSDSPEKSPENLKQVGETMQQWYGNFWAKTKDPTTSNTALPDPEQADQSNGEGESKEATPEGKQSWFGSLTSSEEANSAANPRVTKGKQYGGAFMVGGVTGLLFIGPIGGLVLAVVTTGVAASPGPPGAVARAGGLFVVNGIGMGGRLVTNSLKKKEDTADSSK